MSIFELIIFPFLIKFSYVASKKIIAYKKYSKEICNICKSIKFNCESLYCEEAYSDWLKENAWGKKRGDKND
ncbi:hypothetical protein D1N68_19250 [Clostridioides difficile]|nr:hypothetical protein D1N68_19250 [Clostridioides difficile]